jgi:uncharacterized protein (TIGR02996 family)
MTGEREAFMAAILASPEDDTPRLVFADWLDENGTEEEKARAALIRAQCRAEALPEGSGERRKLEREAKAILKDYGDRWAKPLKDTRLAKGWKFRRGFLDGVTMSATAFAQHAKKLFEAAPTVRSAYFPDASNEVRRGLAGCEYLSRLAAVDLSHMCKCGYCQIHNDLRALFNSKHAKSLTSLNVAGDRMDAEGVKRLAKSAALAKLTSLDLSLNHFGAEGVAELGRAKHLKNLVTLNLSNTGLGADGSGRADDGEGLKALAGVTNLPALRHLDLSNNLIGPEGLEAFAASPLFAQLWSLNLSGNTFDDAGAKLLAAVPEGAKLQRLDVRAVKFTKRAVDKLKKRFGRGLKL